MLAHLPPAKKKKRSRTTKEERELIVAIFKRGNVYWYHFVFNGDHKQESTKQGNPRVARQIEAAHKTRLARGIADLEREKVPSLAGFKQRFLDEIRVRRA